MLVDSPISKTTANMKKKKNYRMIYLIVLGGKDSNEDKIHAAAEEMTKR